MDALKLPSLSVPTTRLPGQTKRPNNGSYFIVTSTSDSVNIKINDVQNTHAVIPNTPTKISIEEEIISLNSFLFLQASITSLDLSGLDTSKVTDMSNMFYGCSRITSLDLSRLDTSKVTGVQQLFRNCSSLTTLQLPTFDLYNSNLFAMFYSCPKLTTITGELRNIRDNLDLSSCPLTNSSAMIFINGLHEVSGTATVKFKSTTFDTLTDEQIALATSKGWTLVSA